LTDSDTLARSALRGDRQLLDRLAAALVRPERDNLVPRPWGGQRISAFKRLPHSPTVGALPFGEAFEISAFNADDEAGRFPSRLRFADGSSLDLPALLEAQGEALLGADFLRRHGPCFPLLPKTLSVKELLSVQGHPAGNTEVYVIIDAEPGATLRLGFKRDVDAGEMAALLTRGLALQRELLERLGKSIDADRLQALIAPWFAAREAEAGHLRQRLANDLESAELAADTTDIEDIVARLKQTYWHVLDCMNEIAVEPGQVIYNATPQRLLAANGAKAAAEVHALGNPEGKEILALEIRRPGPTFRAWDNVRFPQREVAVQAALDALNLSATRAEEFLCERKPVAGRFGTFVSVDCEFFRIEHLLPKPGRDVEVPAAGPHALHCLAGAVTVADAGGSPIGELSQGESALVPVGVGAYRLQAIAAAEIVRVTLPED
jgi:mannose-6-phosphate isomerase class I